MRIAGFCFILIGISFVYQYRIFEEVSNFNGDLSQATGNLATMRYCFEAQVLLFLIAGISMIVGAYNAEVKMSQILSLISDKNQVADVQNIIKKNSPIPIKKIIKIIAYSGIVVLIFGGWAKFLHLSFAYIIITIGLLIELSVFIIFLMNRPYLKK